MNQRPRISICRRLGPIALLFGMLLPAAWQDGYAQVAVSQLLGTAEPIVDEWGEPLRGTDPGAYHLGGAAVQGDLVQVLHAMDNVIYPPSSDGSPDSRNPVLARFRIGVGVKPDLAHAGYFAAALSPRPGGNTRIFVRVLNAADPEEASFYGDSSLFTVSSWKRTRFIVDVDRTLLPLDPGDTDGDGLNNSWERSLGTDAESGDTDGDGLTDLDEHLSETDALDAASGLKLCGLEALGRHQVLSWEAVPGARYQVEFVPFEIDPSGFEAVETVTATGSVHSMTLPVLPDQGAGSWRVTFVK